MKNSLFITLIVVALIIALLINGIFQSLCQQFLGVQEGSVKVCRLTQRLPDLVYWTIYFVLSGTIFYFLYRRYDRKKL